MTVILSNVDKVCVHILWLVLAHDVTHTYSEFFPELQASQKLIEKLISNEEIKFNNTIESGLQKFYEFLHQTKQKNEHILSGESVFILHDTFGFPADLTRILCAENNFEIDMQGYENFMRIQKEKSRADAKFYQLSEDTSPWFVCNSDNEYEDSNFDGYFLKTNFNKNNVNYFQKKFSFNDIKKIRQLKNRSFELVIKNTPFYPEGGGQISDRGYIEIYNGRQSYIFDVIDVRKTPAYISHILRHEEWSDKESPQFSEKHFEELIHPSIEFYCYVDLNFRTDIARNHTATHLLHKSLQIILGNNVRQAGSLVKNDLLRFDFSYHTAVTKEQIEKIENLVNDEILKNSLVYTHQNVPVEQAKKMGAVAMFDEKYSEAVRVLQIDTFSMELCGGTHVNYTGEIGQLKILSESSVTSGVRRIEAVTGRYAIDYVQTVERNLCDSANLLNCTQPELPQKIKLIKEQSKFYEKQIQDLQSKLAETYLNHLLQSATKHNNLTIIQAHIPNVSLQILETLCDRIKSKPNHIAILATIVEGKAHIVAGMHPEITKEYKNIHLGKIVLSLCEKLNGKGGGRSDFAKGSGTSVEKLNAILLEPIAFVT